MINHAHTRVLFFTMSNHLPACNALTLSVIMINQEHARATLDFNWIMKSIDCRGLTRSSLRLPLMVLISIIRVRPLSRVWNAL